jgi:hypothetical protein
MEILGRHRKEVFDYGTLIILAMQTAKKGILSFHIARRQRDAATLATGLFRSSTVQPSLR